MTTSPSTAADASRRPTDRNPWAQTFLSPVPIAFVAGAVGTAVAGVVLSALDVTDLASTWQAWLTGGLAAMFLIAASGRLQPKIRAGLALMVPPVLPHPELIVAVTGALEAAGAIGLLVPATHDLAAVCLALLLVAVYPANVRAARLGERVGSLSSPLVPRTLEQVVWIAACLAVAFG